MSHRVRALTIGTAALASAFLLTLMNPRDTPVESWSLATAYTAILLLGVTLALGPLNLLRSRPNPTHSVLRRDFGIAAGVASLLHTALGLQVHMGGKVWRYFTLTGEQSSSLAAFVMANYIGLLSAIVLLILVAISNNPSIARLGLARWKRAQRFVYVAAIAAVAHGFAYQLMEKRSAPGVAALALIVIAVLTLQLLGRRYRISSTRR